MKQKKIDSYQTFRLALESNLKKINEDKSLLIATMTNPIYALTGLGYDIPEEIMGEIEDRLRFEGQYEKIEALRKRIWTIAGEEFDLDDTAVLERILFEKLNLSPWVEQEGVRKKITLTELPARPGPDGRFLDKLELLTGKHAIIIPLIDYRAHALWVPPFASRKVYNEIISGERPIPFELAIELEIETHELVDINSAGVERLARLPSIGTSIAGRIVAYRQENGRFLTPDSIKIIPGISERVYNEIKDLITVTPK